jgi:C4-dicarboxylate-binding protein DctP
MRRIVILSLLVVIATGAAFAGGRAEPEGEQTFTFRYGNQQPENHSRTISMLWFADELESRTDGRISVEVFHSGVLGTEREMFEQTVSGALHGYRGAFYEQINPQFQIYNLPFLFQNYDEMKYFNQSDFASEMLANGSQGAIYMPAVGFTGLRGQINKERLIMLPEDLRGIKMRSPGQAPILAFYRHFGANPQEVAWSDVYMAVRQGVVDGGDNAASNVLAAKLYEVAPYYTSINYMAGADPLMVNKRWFESLPADLQRIFDEVSVEALAYWDDLEAQAAIDAIQEIAAQPGVTAVDMADYPENVAIWAEASQPLWQQFVDEGLVTWDDINRAVAILEEYRAENN